MNRFKTTQTFLHALLCRTLKAYTGRCSQLTLSYTITIAHMADQHKQPMIIQEQA